MGGYVAEAPQVGHRIVDGLIWAERSARPPGLVGRAARKGPKAQGIAYEKALARELGAAKHGQWWKFTDRNGSGFCQTDFLLERESFAIVLETKLTWVPEGHTQVELLYKPVIEKALRVPVYGIVVCKNLVAGMPKGLTIVNSAKDAGPLALAGHRVVLHWTGTFGLGAG